MSHPYDQWLQSDHDYEKCYHLNEDERDINMQVKVEFEIDISIEATLDQIEEWIEFNLGARGEMSMTNPLINTSIEADSVYISE